MTASRFERLLFIVSFAVCLCALSARAASQSDRQQDFDAKLQEHLKLDDVDGIAKLVKLYQPEAEQHVLKICERAKSMGDEEKKEVAALNGAWQKAFRSGFVNKTYAFFSQLGEHGEKDWREARDALYTLVTKFNENSAGAKDSAVWNEIGENAEKVAKSFEEVGDGYRAGQSWKVAAICYDDTFRKDPDYTRACDDYARAISGYEGVEFNGPDVQQMKTRRTALLAKTGAGGDEKNKPGEPGKPAEPGQEGQGAEGAVTIPMTFQAVEKLDAYQRPHYHVDEIYQMWRVIPFGKNGDEQVLPQVEGSPKFKRVDSAHFDVDEDLDGKYEKQVAITGKPTLLTLTVGAGDKKRDWAFLYTIGTDKDRYNELTGVNLAPNDQQLSLYTCGAASVVGKLGDTQLRVIDDDQNAVYGNAPQTWGHIGISAKVFQPEMDAIVIGDAKRARPWSEYVPIKDQWYKLESDKNGLELKATPAKVELGTVKLDYKGPVWPTWIVLRGINRYENTFIDVAGDGKKGVAVPAGEWHFYYGELRKGAKQETMKSLILPGPNAEKLTWNVEPGKDVTIKLGEPYGFDFDFETSANGIKIPGASVAVTGSAGERYERLWNCIVHPEAEYRKAGTKKASKSQKFDDVTSPDDVNKVGWPALWKPLDLELPMKEKIDKPEVHLFEKKHKLFGSIDSAWKS
jgi:hypothetical protein